MILSHIPFSSSGFWVFDPYWSYYGFYEADTDAWSDWSYYNWFYALAVVSELIPGMVNVVEVDYLCFFDTLKCFLFKILALTVAKAKTTIKSKIYLFIEAFLLFV